METTLASDPAYWEPWWARDSPTARGEDFAGPFCVIGGDGCVQRVGRRGAWCSVLEVAAFANRTRVPIFVWAGVANQPPELYCREALLENENLPIHLLLWSEHWSPMLGIHNHDLADASVVGDSRAGPSSKKRGGMPHAARSVSARSSSWGSFKPMQPAPLGDVVVIHPGGAPPKPSGRTAASSIWGGCAVPCSTARR